MQDRKAALYLYLIISGWYDSAISDSLSYSSFHVAQATSHHDGGPAQLASCELLLAIHLL